MCIICGDKKQQNQITLKCCDKIKKVPVLSGIINLDCNEEESIKFISNNPEYKIIDCSWTSVKVIPKTNAKFIECENCFKLRKIKQNNNVEKLFCANSYRLVTLPQLPNLNYLIINDCVLLLQLPKLFKSPFLISGNNPLLYIPYNIPKKARSYFINKFNMINRRYILKCMYEYFPTTLLKIIILYL